MDKPDDDLHGGSHDRVADRVDDLGFGSGDIESAIAHVGKLLAEDVQEDLKALMQRLERLKRQKQNMREVLEALKERRLEEAEATVVCTLRALGELSEMESLRLQMTLDRTSKLMSTLSNILKKSSDTASSITDNLK